MTNYLDKIFRVKYKFNLIYCSEIELLTSQTHSTLLQAEEKCARNPVPKCPSKQLTGTFWDRVTRLLFLQNGIMLTVGSNHPSETRGIYLVNLSRKTLFPQNLTQHILKHFLHNLIEQNLFYMKRDILKTFF